MPEADYRTEDENRLEAILSAAQEEFIAHGLNGTRIGDIARRANLEVADIHSVFRNKNILYLAVLDNIIQTWNGYFSDVTAKDDPAIALDTLIRQKVRLSMEQPAISRLFANEILQGAPVFSDHLANVIRPWVRDRATIIQAWTDAGKMKATDPELLIFMIWAVTQHYADFEVQVLQVTGLPCYDEAAIRRVSDFVSHMILTGCGLEPLVPLS